MPTYEYQCDDCGSTFEQVRRFNEEPLPCKCGSNKLTQIIHAPMVFVKGEATTLGQLADRNTSKMGRYELDSKREQQEKGNLKDKKEKNWVQKSGDASVKDINKMSDSKKQRYIRDGRK